MSAPLLLLAGPSFLALIIFVGLRRSPRAAGLIGASGALLIAFLLSGADLQSVGQPTGLIAGDTLTFFGGVLQITPGMQRVMLLIYTAGALLFLLAARWSQGPDFVPAALAALAPLAFAMMVTPLAYGAIGLLLAAALLAALVQGQRPGSTLASLRYLILTTLAVPALLVAGWMLESQQLALSGALWRLFLLGAALLLAGFPFHIWVRPLLNEAHPLTAVFVLAPVQLGILTFVWRWLQQHSAILLNAQLTSALGWSGAAVALFGAILAFSARDARRLLGSLVLADMGAVLICLGQGLVGIEQAWALLLVRFGALLLAAVGVQWCAERAGIDASLVEGAHLAQQPLAAALVAYGALALSGLPLTPGFATRWAAISLAGDVSLAWSLALALAVAAGIAGVLRVFGPILPRQWAGRAGPLAPPAPEQRLRLALLGAAALLLLYLSLFPWPLLNIAATLNELF